MKQKTVVVVTPFGFGFATKAKEKERKPLSPEQIAAAAIIAGGIVKQLRAVANDCKRLNKPEYEIDCLSEGYSRATRGIPDDDALGDARGAVSKAATALAELAAANRAADLPAIRSGKQARAVTAIEPARLTAARAKAAEIIGETQTVLLRSAESSDLRESYQKIAVSLDTGKALLRS